MTVIEVATAGAWRVLTGATTTATAPSAPSIVGISAGDAQVTVSWLAPQNTGGSALTGYTVTVSPGAHTASVSAATTSAVITGLTNGTAYSATVTATNSVGSTTSTPSASVTPTATTTGAWPNANTTGLPVGAAGDNRAAFPGGEAALISMTGSTVVSQMNAGQTSWDGRLITGGVSIPTSLSGTFTFTRCIFRGPKSLQYVITVNAGQTIQLYDCEIDGQGDIQATDPTGGAGPYPSGDAPTIGVYVHGGSLDMQRCNVHGCEDGVRLNAPGSITDSYFHDDAHYWKASNSTTHSDCVQSTAGASISGVTIQGNWMDPGGPIGNSGIQLGAMSAAGVVFTNWTITGNHFGGGNYTFNANTGTAFTLSNCVFTNNEVQPDSSFGADSGSFRGLGWTTWSGNKWAASGTLGNGTQVLAGQAIT